MSLSELLRMLDLDAASEFESFDNISDLVESDEEIDMDVLYQLFKDVDMDVMVTLFGTYFEDIMEAVPGRHVDLYSLLDSVKRMLIGMAANMEDENGLLRMAEEFARFRRWYSIESEVWVDENGAKGLQTCMTVRDALTQSRLESLDGSAESTYNFDNAMDFEIDEYSMSFADLVNEE